ncbi:gamma-tubulin complex component 5 [Belonocnema kinseyi]|uniref:gamma-tubulin complex component 5 n=1 Tax=Belonocnema kinseyi TaxID=2817044 RepID=UPI00143DADAC|nr:gamma-tubulin complex component 5 [Belonocnema kinseyi]
MGTKILEDIRNDLKLLIECITGFQEDEEGFILCERYALSQIKHHRYLSVNGHQVRKEISEVVKKFQIHAKYEIAEKFQELVDSFLNNFDFERHPQYDLQWSLLSLLFNLSTDTSKSDLANLEQIANVPSDDNKPESIDWARYLKEGQDEFFSNYQSTSDSDWSDDEVEGVESSKADQEIPLSSKDLIPIEAKSTDHTVHKLSKCITDEFASRNWLATNVQHSWWNELDWHQHQNTSKVPSATLCEFWRKNTLKSPCIISTLSEYQVCRELLWMFHVQEPMAIFQSQNALEFSIRDNISIPSLTVASFKSILLAYCDYFGIIHELEEFGKKLYSRGIESEEIQKPPLTYEAYNAAVQQYLLRMKEEVVRIEQKFMAQEGSNTFLTISKELRKHLNFVRMLHEIHQSVTANWETCSNWIRTSKLLSTLYHEMQNSSSHERTNMCANLYLSAITVYLNIIDAWLSEGRLEDWREEFVIVRERERRSQEEGKLYKRFAVRELDEKCAKDPIMQLLLQKVCQMGRSIELLVTLDRLSDMWDTMNDRNVYFVTARKVTLNEEFRREVASESSKYNVSCDTTDIVVPKVQTHFFQIADQSILHQASISDNPFLMKAFESYLPIDESRADTVDETDLKSEGNKKTESFVRFELISNSILPLRKVFENALSRILDFRYISASKLVKEIMIREYKLEENLKLMRSVYMMERGHIMNRFCNQMFSEIESNIMWNNSYFLTGILEEVISEEWPDTSSRWSITVDNVRTHHVLHAVNGISLHYAIGWPINMLLNDETLSKYNSIFRFELKLKWALWTLNNLRFADLEGSKSKEVTDSLQHFHMRRLECLRFWLLHAIGAIHVYLSGQVLHSLGIALESELAQADNLDSIIKIHQEYLNKVHEHCLQTSQFEDLMSTINQLLEMCVVVRDTWKTGSQNLEGKKLDLLESTYIKYHTYLALALHNAVQHHNATYLTSLTSAFNCSMPTT